MASKNEVILRFAGDTASLDRAFSGLQKQSSATQSRFSGLARGAKIAAAAFLGGLAVAAKVGFDELLAGQKVAAQTTAVIKSTGGAANVSAGQVSRLAESLMKKSGVDDEVIASGENVILTFTRIRNEAGKGNDIFNQATRAALDYSVALGTDMTSASMLVGKALNDPIKGLSQLGRAGVQFTEAQKAQIKAMVESGNVMGAQKVILGELETQFGGSAEAAGKTLAGQLNVARETFTNLAGSIVGAVLPAFLAFAGILGVVADWMSQHQTLTVVIIGVLGGLAAAVLAVNAAVKVYTAAQIILNAVLTANPIGLVIVAIAALAAGIVIAWQRSETFRSIVKGSFDAVKTAAIAVKDAVENIVSAMVAAWQHPVVQAIAAPYRLAFNGIKEVVTGADDAIRAIVGALRAAKDWEGWEDLKGVFGGTWSAIKSVVNSVAEAISNVISKAQSAINWIGSLKDKAASIGNKLLPGSPFADGGVVYGPTRALIGEAGPEVVIPLTRPARAEQLMRRTGLDRRGGPSGPSTPAPMIHVAQMVVQDSTDVYRVASQLGRQLRMA